MQVESVAWITEQKNTLSAVFYLAAGWPISASTRRAREVPYIAALVLFLLGLLSKTVTATLPAALLVVFWWQRGRLSWRRDVLPLAPFFVLGAVAGGFTAWVERKLIGAEGPAFALTLVERFLLGGRAIWFYSGQTVLAQKPDLHLSSLAVEPRDMEAILWPAAALVLVAALWALRRRWRGPLAALLFFAGTLFPVLGLFNVYPFLYSFVADHFQYLASLGIMALASAGIALLLGRWRLWGRPGATGYV